MANEVPSADLEVRPRLVNPEIGKILRDSLDDQMLLMASGRFDRFKGAEGNDFLAAFCSDPLFVEIYKQAQAEALKIENDISFERGLRGAIFEKMSYAYLSSLDGDAIPIMGEDVLGVLKALNPGWPLIDNGFGLIGIKGRYIPDGFILREAQDTQVVGIIECSLGRWDKKRGKDFQVSSAKRLVEDLGSFALEPALHIVSPDFIIPADLSLEDSAIRLIPVVLPLALDTFMDEFIPFIYKDQKASNGKTLAQLRVEYHESSVGQQLAVGEPAFFRKA